MRQGINFFVSVREHLDRTKANRPTTNIVLYDQKRNSCYMPFAHLYIVYIIAIGLHHNLFILVYTGMLKHTAARHLQDTLAGQTLPETADLSITVNLDPVL